MILTTVSHSILVLFLLLINVIILYTYSYFLFFHFFFSAFFFILLLHFYHTVSKIKLIQHITVPRFRTKPTLTFAFFDRYCIVFFFFFTVYNVGTIKIHRYYSVRKNSIPSEITRIFVIFRVNEY